MPNPIISVKNLSKSYRLYSRPSDRLKEALWPWLPRHRLFYALHDVNFDVFKGEHIGIIGVNGAGKSTLLQIITGVLSSTQGEVLVNGKVSALLELGAGFNPELTGRENAVFQLQIGGVPKFEILNKIKEIEAFADVGIFFDQPVKFYSSGMYARVAFSVTAFAEPDILIADEILSVGDLKFQAKCADRIELMRRNGCTILFVSHAMSSIVSLCTKTLYLKHGRVHMFDDPDKVANAYYKDQANDDKNKQSSSISDNVGEKLEVKTHSAFTVYDCEIKKTLNVVPNFGTGQARIVKYQLTDCSGSVVNVINPGVEYIISICVYPVESVSYWHASFYFRNAKGVILYGSGTKSLGYSLPCLKANEPVVINFKFQSYFVREAVLLSIAIGDSAETAYDSLQDALDFDKFDDEKSFGTVFGSCDVYISRIKKGI